MQRIERYGVIALVFLLVTILAVSLWGEGEVALLTAKEKDQTGRGSAAPAADLPIARTSPLSNRGARDRALPTSDSAGANDVASRDGKLGPAQPAELDREPDLGPDLQHRGGGRRSLPTPETLPVVDDQPLRRPPLAVQAPTEYRPVFEAPAPRRPSEPLEIAAARSCVVGAGETLSQIAQRELGTSRRWPEIAALNGNLAPEALQKGMVLKLPARDGAQAAQLVAAATGSSRSGSTQSGPAPQQPLAAASAPSGARTYRIRKGDVLGTIAQRELGSSRRWKEIAQLNPTVDPERLIVGANLLLPGGAPAQRSAAGAAADVRVAQAEPAAAGWSPNRSGGKVR